MKQKSKIFELKKLLFSKKGDMEITTIWLIDLILIVIIIFGIFTPALVKQNQNEKFFKRFSSKNIALLLDTIYTTPYPLKVYYNEKTLSFSYLFEQNKVFVLGENDIETAKDKIGYVFIEDNNKEMEYKKIIPQITYEGDDNEVSKSTYLPIAFLANYDYVRPLSSIPTGIVLGEGSSIDEIQTVDLEKEPEKEEDVEIQTDETKFKEDSNGCSIIPGYDVDCRPTEFKELRTHNGNVIEPDCIVLHYSVGNNVDQTDQVLRDRELSAHYILGRNCEIIQQVPDDMKAYHAYCEEGETCENDCPVCKKDGEIINVNSRCIGIEIDNYGYDCKDRDHKEGISCTNQMTNPYSGKTDTWEIYKDEQVECIIDLVSYIANKNNIPKDRDHIVGHDEVANYKNDPGPAFNWNKLIDEINKK